MLTAFSAEAAELWRLRYFVPTSAESEITFGSSKAAEKLNTSGHSGNLVFANGIGVGYSTLRSNVSLEGVSYIFRNDSLDLSYTIGNSLSFTFGAGPRRSFLHIQERQPGFIIHNWELAQFYFWSRSFN